MKTELEEIQKKLVEGEERNVSGMERLGYVLGSCSSEDASVALAVDWLSHFGWWDELFSAKKAELEGFKQLEPYQINEKNLALLIEMENLARQVGLQPAS